MLKLKVEKVEKAKTNLMAQQPTNRHFEGPARLVSNNHDEHMLREEGRGIPKSYACYLSETYGPEGIGWGFETDTDHAQENELRKALHEPEFLLATEALRNALAGFGYRLNDGTNVTNKIQRNSRPPDTGNVVVYPDGDVYKQKKGKE